MKKLLLILIAVMFFVLTACSSQSKEFQSCVDQFTGTYYEAKDADDELTQDIKLKVAAGDLWDLSKMYQDAKDPEALNEYLDKHVTKEMFEEIYTYNEEYTGYPICTELIEHFS